MKNLISATGAETREQKDYVREVVHSLSREGMIEQVAEGKYRLSASEREILEGVVDMTSSGALYVVVEGQDKDIYVDEAHAGPCVAR